MKLNKSNIVTIFLVPFSLIVMTGASTPAFAQAAPGVIDPAMEIFRVRCQIDVDIDPATGLASPKVQIQGKARADLLDGANVNMWVENLSRVTPPPATVNTVIALGSATADWDTFPDLADPTLVTFVAGDFAQPDELIEVIAQVTLGGITQTVSDTGTCADKTSAQFKQDTKNVCKLKDFNRNKCKSGDILPDGTIMP
jgi:hypothetical protein